MQSAGVDEVGLSRGLRIPAVIISASVAHGGDKDLDTWA
jgi:hypothetical protein